VIKVCWKGKLGKKIDVQKDYIATFQKDLGFRQRFQNGQEVYSLVK